MNIERIMDPLIFFKRPIILCLICISLIACGQQSEIRPLITLTGLTMGTTYTVKINSPELNPHHLTIKPSKISDEIKRRLEDINKQMSNYLETSILSTFNQSKTKQWTAVPSELYLVIKEALRINKLSDNAFDITIGPVVNLWGFGPEGETTSIPNDIKINETLKRVGSQHLHISEESNAIMKQKPDIYIDLSAIAKGYGVDHLAKYLDEIGFHNYMIEIGGEIKTKGLNQNNQHWRIGIEKPLNDQRTVQTIVTLNNTGLATSGDYRNYFEKEDIRYSHTINPNTGKPITHKVASVTVLHPSTMTADAMATALLVLGADKGLELANKEKLAAMFLIRNHDNFIEKMTPEFKRALVNSE